MPNPVQVVPYSQSDVTTNTAPINVNYTNQDFYSMKSRLVSFINERFGPSGTILPDTFNDLVEASVAIMLIENWAFLADTLSFKMDQIVNELFIDTVTEIDNAFRLAELVGFNPQPPIAATSMWVATINNPLTVDLVLSTPLAISVVSNNTPITIELFPSDSTKSPMLNDNIIIPAGSVSNNTIIGLEGTTRTDTFQGTGDVGQTYQLSYFPVIYDSIRLQVDGIMWREVESFTDSQPRREYRVEFDSSYNGYIIFGNGAAGLIPSNGSVISVTYRQGGGVVGNIVTGFVTTQTQVSVPGYGYSISVSLQNYTSGQNGYDGDTIDDIRTKLPLYLQAQNRCVSGEDYQIFADQFATPYHGQIGKSVAVLRNFGCSGNIIDLYILAVQNISDLEIASNELKVDLTEALSSIKMMTDFVCIKNGVVISTDIIIDVTANKLYRKFELEMTQNITNLVNAFFSLSNWSFGQSLKSTDILKLLSNMQQVEDVMVNLVTNDPNNSGTQVVAQFNEIIRPDTITINFTYE